MKFVFLFSLIIASILSASASECEVLKPQTAGPLLKSFRAETQRAGTAELVLVAFVPGGSWGKQGSEAAVLTIFVDGVYDQDVVLFAGAERFEYRLPMASVNSEAPANVAIHLNTARSAKGSREVKIQNARVEYIQEEGSPRNGFDIDRAARQNSPLIHLRSETIDRFSDIPLITYYELTAGEAGRTTVRYTTIFTNEDGGTNSQALLARWGRLTDIEWVYEMVLDASGNRVAETYQGANHVTKTFKGRRVATHPLIYNVTVNNNFADDGCSAVRLSPRLVRADLSSGSRETIMDANPWTHRIMAEETAREGRVDPTDLGPNKVDDPRNYYYAEVQTVLRGTAISIRLPDGRGGHIDSDHGSPHLRVDRSGFVRIAVRKPPMLKEEWPDEVELVCHAKGDSGSGECESAKLINLIRLDMQYRPVTLAVQKKNIAIKTGASTRIELAP